MKTVLPKLAMPGSVEQEIGQIVAQTPVGIETGVALFGVRQNEYRIVLFAVGPGPRAIHSSGYFQPDEDYLNIEYERLMAEWPGLEWIGTLHAHPFGMTGLSGHDHRTLIQLLENKALRLPDFVAGIIQRNQSRQAIYPYLVEREGVFPWLMPIEIQSPESEWIKQAQNKAKRKLTETASAALVRNENPRSRTAWVARSWFIPIHKLSAWMEKKRILAKLPKRRIPHEQTN